MLRIHEDAERKIRLRRQSIERKYYSIPRNTPAAGGTLGKGVQTVYWAL